MFSLAHFESGLRLDQYIASIAMNKENFRANFMKALDAYSAEDIAFFRGLRRKVHIAIVTEDENPDALRDVPVISRISVEVGRVALRIFRPKTHPDAIATLAQAVGLPEVGKAQLPVIAIFDSEMALLSVHVRRIAALDEEMKRRQLEWAAAHPEVQDAGMAIEAMTPITRTRMNQALYSHTPEQRQQWAARAIALWRTAIASSQPAIDGPAFPAAPGTIPASALAAAAAERAERQSGAAPLPDRT
jgi:hypothetical protein